MTKTKDITIHKDSDVGNYTIIIGGEVEYECLAKDEVMEIVEELLKGGSRE